METKTRDGGQLGEEDKRTLRGCGGILIGWVLVAGYLGYKLIMWLCNQTS